jgi:hypothetical protein
LRIDAGVEAAETATAAVACGLPDNLEVVMRAPAWVVVVAALVAVPAVGPARAQPVTVPGPDFDNDGFGDLAIGVPGERVGGAAGAGAVSVLFGSGPDGLGGAGSQLLSQGTGGAGGAVEPGDGFAGALATGRG